MCPGVHERRCGGKRNPHLALMRGNYDALLPWPFGQKVSLTVTLLMLLLDHAGQDLMMGALRPDPTSSTFRRQALRHAHSVWCMSLTRY